MTATERLAEIRRHIGSNTEHDLVAALEAVLTQTAAMREVAATGYSDRTTRLILESWADEIEAAITEALGVDQ